MIQSVRPHWLITVLVLGLPVTAVAEPTAYEWGGDVRSRATLQLLPDNSAIYQATGDAAADLSAILRLKFGAIRERWDMRADGQLFVLYGDSIDYSRELAAQAPGFEAIFGRLPNDDRRWWNLSDTLEDKNKLALIARFDRLSVGYTNDALALRFGRQAVTWGNGLIYTPMDIVNPFDPTQVDTEYKPGDDMLYGQYLLASGNDIQTAYVVRRDPLSGNIESGQATLAAKYHGFLGPGEVDLLVAEHYGEALLGVGGGVDVGGAVWRSDLVLSDTEGEGWIAQFVLNSSYSWVAAGRNMTGSIEYFFNGFGQRDGCYSPWCLSENPELLARVARRQLFTLGRQYLGASVMVEVTPLFTVTPNIFWNLGDDSGLVQLVTRNSLGDNLVLLGALAVPLGASGTEYGGIDTAIDGLYFSTDLSAFAQLNWYF